VRYWCSLVLALNASLLILYPEVSFSQGQAQPAATSPAHVPAPIDAALGGFMSLALAVLLIALIVAGVWLRQQRRRRREAASELEAQLAAAFLREPRLAGLVLIPRVWIPAAPEESVKVAIAGSIPRIELRAVVLQLAREEMKDVEGEMVFEDRLTVRPTAPPVAA
jgi:hypothetical protein